MSTFVPPHSKVALLAGAVSLCVACGSSSGPNAASASGADDGADAGTPVSVGSSPDADAGPTPSPIQDDAGSPESPTVDDAGSTSTPVGADAGTAAADAGTTSAGGWAPSSAAPIHFHWQLSDTFTTADLLANQAGAVVYDIDGESATAADVAAIHAAGAKAICYVDVGTLEKGRSDFAQFPASVVGPAVQGWPGENWFLVTAANQPTLLPLMKARFQNWCAAKGFDSIEPDNLDAFTNISGVTQADNVAYDLAVAGLARAQGLSIGLKNLLPDVDASYIPKLLASFSWALVEQCYEYTECAVYTQAGSFIAAGKPVWDVEYNVAPDCTQADQGDMNAQRRDLNLVAPTSSGYTYTPCVGDSQATW